MCDFREYGDAIRAAVKKINAEDAAYTWKVQAINKAEARFSWSYLSEKDGFFSVSCYAEAEDGECNICVKVPVEDKNIIVMVGESFYHDAQTVEEGIKMAIAAAAKYAHRVF